LKDRDGGNSGRITIVASPFSGEAFFVGDFA